MTQDPPAEDLLQISLCDSSDSDAERNHVNPNKQRRAERLNQTENAFYEQVRSWKPICDLGLARERRQWNPDEVLGVANADVPSRETALVWKWCAEDRYFLRQYWDATKFGEAALRCRDLHETEMQELEQLRERCGKKLGLDSTSSKERIQNES